MDRMKEIAVRKAFIGLLSLAVATGCKEPTASGDDSSGTENLPVLMGNFAINTGNITTNQDGVSKNIVDDFVLPSQLPNVRFEAFTTHLYAPVASDVSTSVGNVHVYVGIIGGVKSGDIFQEAHFVQRVTVSGQEYAVYQLNGFYNGTPAITKANFANVSFEMSLTYKDSYGASLASRNVTLGVYQRQ
jgi:hypothetical protein